MADTKGESKGSVVEKKKKKKKKEKKEKDEKTKDDKTKEKPGSARSRDRKRMMLNYSTESVRARIGRNPLPDSWKKKEPDSDDEGKKRRKKKAAASLAEGARSKTLNNLEDAKKKKIKNKDKDKNTSSVSMISSSGGWKHSTHLTSADVKDEWALLAALPPELRKEMLPRIQLSENGWDFNNKDTQCLSPKSELTPEEREQLISLDSPHPSDSERQRTKPTSAKDKDKTITTATPTPTSSSTPSTPTTTPSNTPVTTTTTTVKPLVPLPKDSQVEEPAHTKTAPKDKDKQEEPKESNSPRSSPKEKQGKGNKDPSPRRYTHAILPQKSREKLITQPANKDSTISRKENGSVWENDAFFDKDFPAPTPENVEDMLQKFYAKYPPRELRSSRKGSGAIQTRAGAEVQKKNEEAKQQEAAVVETSKKEENNNVEEKISKPTEEACKEPTTPNNKEETLEAKADPDPAIVQPKQAAEYEEELKRKDEIIEQLLKENQEMKLKYQALQEILAKASSIAQNNSS